MTRVLLEVVDFHVYIGPFYIVQGVSFNLEYGECLALIGRNGAGKTTLIKGILGLTGPTKGEVLFEEKNIISMKPYERANLGIGYVPDTRRIFPNLTVEENLILASLRDRDRTQDRLEHVYSLFPDLKKLKKLKAGALSGGQQQMLNIARALMQKNKLILVDEPTEGLSPVYVNKINEALKELIASGVSILLVEGRPTLLRNLASKYAIMSSGKIVDNGEIRNLFTHPELIKKYLGVELR
ncbi:MAG: ABC transporter ATP-binding protein [Desulfurococcales archaeon]|nr:ABC transporter ATP-binding protein [Desulfurococcales archaeon]